MSALDELHPSSLLTKAERERLEKAKWAARDAGYTQPVKAHQRSIPAELPLRAQRLKAWEDIEHALKRLSRLLGDKGTTWADVDRAARVRALMTEVEDE